MSEIEVSRPVREQLIELRHGGRPIRELIEERLSAGLSMRQIAREFGIHYVSLYDIAAREAIPLPGRRRNS